MATLETSTQRNNLELNYIMICMINIGKMKRLPYFIKTNANLLTVKHTIYLAICENIYINTTVLTYVFSDCIQTIYL